MTAPTAPYWSSSPKTMVCLARSIREMDSAMETWEASSMIKQVDQVGFHGEILGDQAGIGKNAG